MSFEPVGGTQYLSVWPFLIAVYNITLRHPISL